MVFNININQTIILFSTLKVFKALYKFTKITLCTYKISLILTLNITCFSICYIDGVENVFYLSVQKCISYSIWKIDINSCTDPVLWNCGVLAKLRYREKQVKVFWSLLN